MSIEIDQGRANSRGALFMMASMASFTMNDAFMKALSGDLHLAQAIFMRGVLTVPMMLVLAMMLGGLRLRLPRRDWHLIGMRNVTEVGAAYFFLTAIFNMPIANATAILQALPLTITLASAVFLGEPVGWRRWTAILIGFFGVMLIVRPGFEGFTIYSLYALGAVVMVTARDLLSRKLSPTVPSMTVAVLNALSVTVVFGIAAAFQDWAPISGASLGRLAGAAVLIIGGYVFSVSAMRAGDVAVIAPFRYTSLLWALALGAAIFGEYPDGLTLTGATIVVLMGIYTFHRERQVVARARAQG